ncbi:hypothetical protein H8K35_01465 [Undibacterium sp. LX40W]|uniref:Uncharacterized protein n=1 Tax=Undibacterium nitidum TaxID=2762298 RepID=A0A923KKM5_9BURK|nr:MULTISPECIES: hypothetical protein [Undibacterium]MBC3880950.1 hypothetical protein [Undibacterium nitidum]MBC3890317.1 hypothetical protein [Undibacterium sp. LX40W]
MTNQDWKKFLQTSREVLGKGSCHPYSSESWCAFTTFSSLIHGVHYFTLGLPDIEDCLESRTIDGGVWAQSIEYDDLAHIIIPETFYWERTVQGFESGYKTQNIKLLSEELLRQGIEHRLTDLVLEIKVY